MAFRMMLALVGIVAGLGVASGCGGGRDSQLNVLELEQLASFVAPGGTIEPAEEAGDGEVSRVFAYDDTAAADAGRKAAIEAANASGWTLTFDEGDPGDPIFGAKELSTGEVTLVIGQYEEGDLVKVSIRLEHGPCTGCVPGGREAASPPSPDEPDQSPAQQQSDPLDDPLSVPGSIIVLPSAPSAWAAGPYVTRLGEPIELDGSGSYDRDGQIVSYEWDLDGDGDFDLTTPKPSSPYTYEKPFDGKIRLRVTDDDGKTAVALARAHASIDGDESEPPADNCPEVANHGQSDWDSDGAGDACDPTPFGG